MHLSLWLLPPSPVYEKLRANIADLAEKYDGGGPFEPHVTIVGGRLMPCASHQDIVDLATIMGEGLKDFGGVPCRFYKEVVSMYRPDSTLIWNQSCVSVMERSDKFMQLIERSRQLLGVEDEPYSFPPPLEEPHFSHFYGETFLPSVDDIVMPPDFIAKEAALWITSGGFEGVKTWQEVARISLCGGTGPSTTKGE